LKDPWIRTYTGPIALKNNVDTNIYVHFSTLHVAVLIIVSPELVNKEFNIKYAEDLLDNFIRKPEKSLQQLARRYGEQKGFVQIKNPLLTDKFVLQNQHFDRPLTEDLGNINFLQYK
ncbi:hypothetical protein PV327_011710, partial [Microctonus hyperodae]